MKETVQRKYWFAFRVGRYREFEYATDDYYIDGWYAGSSEMYATGRAR